MTDCDHEWIEARGRGHTYVTCRFCHRFPPSHLSTIRALENVHIHYVILDGVAKSLREQLDTARIEARAEALEEAARQCEDESVQGEAAGYGHCNPGLRQAAKRIRDLARLTCK